MDLNRATIIIIYKRLSGFQRLNLALKNIAIEDQIIIAGRIPKHWQKTLRQIYSGYKMSFADESASSKNIIKTLINATKEESIIITDTYCPLNAVQINEFKSLMPDNQDKLIVANLLSVKNNTYLRKAMEIERLFFSSDGTPFYFRPIAGIGATKALLEKINQIIVQYPVNIEQTKTLTLNNYPKITLKMMKIGKSVLSIDMDLQYQYPVNRVLLLINAVINGYRLESLTKLFPLWGVNSNSKLSNLNQIYINANTDGSLFTKLLILCWSIGIMSKKLLYSIAPHIQILRSLRKASYIFKDSGLINWRTNTRMIEIELTSYCDLNCYNCDRNIRQARTNEQMSMEQITKFVNKSIEDKYPWKEIKIMGGEPTLHPQLREIIKEFERLHLFNPKINFIIITNGFGEKSKDAIGWLPGWITIYNSIKSSHVNDFFEFNMAPIDFDFKYNLETACRNTECCGISLSRYGFFLCGPGAAIARVIGLDIGLKKIEELQLKPEELWQQRNLLCRYCGGIKDKYRKNLTREEKMSPTWVKACADYKESKPDLSLY